MGELNWGGRKDIQGIMGIKRKKEVKRGEIIRIIKREMGGL